MEKTTTTSWEDEFDRVPHGAPLSSRGDYISVINAKDFIRTLLTTQKRELREKIENAPGFLVFKSTEQGEAELPCMTKRSIIALLDESSS